MNQPGASGQPGMPPLQPSNQQMPVSSQEGGPEFDGQRDVGQPQQMPSVQGAVALQQRNNKIAPVAKPAGLDPLILMQERENRFVCLIELTNNGIM